MTPMSFTSSQSWVDDPGLMWAWYQQPRHQLQAVEANAGHRAIAERSTLAELHVITQNVDDLRERAGVPETVHTHGKLLDSHCGRCQNRYQIPVEEHVSYGWRRCAVDVKDYSDPVLCGSTNSCRNITSVSPSGMRRTVIGCLLRDVLAPHIHPQACRS